MATSVQAVAAQSLAAQSANLTKPQKDIALQQGDNSVGAIGPAAVYEPSENAKNHLNAGVDVQARSLGVGDNSVGAIGPAAVYEPSENAKNHLNAGVDVQARSLGVEEGTVRATIGADPHRGEEMTMSSGQNVEMEVQRLKAERQKVQAQMNQASDSDQKVALQQQLRQLEAEIQRKDSVSYRQSHARYWQA